MRKSPGAKYFFRGTTIGWPGNRACQQLPRTPTTTNPAKALLFALCCRDRGAEAVIYIAKAAALKHLAEDRNVLAKVEDEVGFVIAPADYLLLCEGYIYVSDAIWIINRLKVAVPPLHDKSMLDFALKETPSLSGKLVDAFFEMAFPLLQNA